MANVRDVCTWKIYFWNKRQRGVKSLNFFQEFHFSPVGGRFDERHIFDIIQLLVSYFLPAKITFLFAIFRVKFKNEKQLKLGR